MHELDDAAVIARLRAGDEDTFMWLVERLGPVMQRVARGYARDESSAEEVCQDAWLAVLRGLERFEGRSSLRSWIFAIVVNKAKTRGQRDRRMVPFSSLARDEAERDDPSVAADRFAGPEARWPRHWAIEPVNWGEDPEKRLLAKETRAHLAAALDTLPPAQRTVVVMRDLAGQSQNEICNVLGISETNARVLLHRGRAKIRSALAGYLTGGKDAA